MMTEFFRTFLGNITEQLGISSKIINSLISGDNELDGGREYIYETSLQLLKENPLGLGMYWDRFVLEDYSYAHSFIYEILVGFGWGIGGLLLISIVKNTLVLISCKDKDWKVLFIMFFSLSMIRLFLSYSFWYDNHFWAMISIIIGYRYSVRNKNKCALEAGDND